MKHLWAVLILIGSILSTATAAVASPDISGEADGDAYGVVGADRVLGGGGHVGNAVANPDVQYLPGPVNCLNQAPGTPETPACPSAVIASQAAPCPTGARLPLFWTRSRDAASVTGWTPWALVPGACPGNPGFPGITAADFQRLPLVPSAIHVEPPTGWTLVNLPTIVYASGEPQSLRTTVVGIGVTVRATPASFTWTFGDGSPPLATTDPGKAYPAATITHAYLAAGVNRIRLVTQWNGEFLVDGSSTWLPVTGTAETTSNSEPLTVYTAHSRLVAGPS
jgi:hypothetical protein